MFCFDFDVLLASFRFAPVVLARDVATDFSLCSFEFDLVLRRDGLSNVEAKRFMRREN